MFTGLVERIGKVEEISHKEGLMELSIRIPSPDSFTSKLGDSIAVNGCCLTLTSYGNEIATFDVSKESLQVTNLGSLKQGSPVNLERALIAGSRLGGHIVSGHVDCLATLLTKEPQRDGWLYKVAISRYWSKYLIHKGSLTLDGVSLTINKLTDEKDRSIAELMLIPTTLEHTTLRGMTPGWKINLEVDLVGKYIERFEARK